MTDDAFVEIEGYRLARNRSYHPDTHVWVEPLSHDPIRVRLGLDALGLETTGTLAQLAIVPVGTRVERGAEFGSLEAEKFVGPLTSPLTGTVVAVNDDVIANPRRVQDDPLEAWFVELAPEDFEADAALLVSGDAITAWFREKLIDYRLRGVLAQ